MVNEFRKAILVAVVLAAILAACAPAQPAPEQIQSQVGTSVALTVEAQNGMATSVAQTLVAQAPQPTATSSPTAITLNLPAAAPNLATVTPFVVVQASGSSGGASAPDPVQYACKFREVKPLINIFKPGDPFDIVWVITNTGTKTWPSFLDFTFVSGTNFTTRHGFELPALEPGDSTTVSFDANAPTKPGFYEMRWKVQGGLCFPFTDIQVGKPRDP